jgi:hypothetical protein
MRKPTPIKPMGVSINDTLPKRILRWTLSAIGAVTVAVLLFILIVEALVGCGETYTDSKGVQHEQSCVFVK